MACRSVQLLCLVVGFAAPAEARILAPQPINGGSTLKAIQVVKALNAKTEPTGLVGDKAPSAEGLHFNHPYPVVQDGGDFDKDFVQDQNSDNGSWKAQMLYDKLRHLLNKQKAELPPLKTKMDTADKALDSTTKEMRKEISQQTYDIAEKQARLAKLLAADEKADATAEDKMDALKSKLDKTTDHMESRKDKLEEIAALPKHEPKKVPFPTLAPAAEKKKEEPKKSWCDWWPFSLFCSKPEEKSEPTPAPPTHPKVKGIPETKELITEATKQHVSIQEELSEAKAELKDAMAKLEKAKEEHSKAQQVKEAKITQQHAEEKIEVKVNGDYMKEFKEFAAAQKEFNKQQEKIDRLKRLLKADSALIKKQRDAEDPTGGVYNTPKESFASSMAASPLLIVVAAVAMRF